MQSIKLLCNNYLYTKLSEFPVYVEITCKFNFKQILKWCPNKMAGPFPMSQAEAGREMTAWTALQESWGRRNQNGAHVSQELRAAVLLPP